MKRKKVVVMLGLPGSGKGTHSKQLQVYDFKRIGMSEVLSEKKGVDVQFAHSCKNHCIKTRNLFPDELVIPAFSEKLKTFSNASLVLDGFPRTDGQLLFLLSLVEQMEWQMIFIHLHCKAAVAEERLSTRKLPDGSQRVEDIDPEERSKGIIDFANHLESVLALLNRTRYNVMKVNVDRPIHIVSAEIRSIVFNRDRSRAHNA